MSTILFSSTAPAPSVNAGRSSPTRDDAQDQGAQGSFGQILERTQQPVAEKPVIKTAAPVRHQDSPEKVETQDLVNPMTALLVPFENRTGAAALPGGSAPSDGKAALVNVLPGGSAPSDATVTASTHAALVNALAAGAPEAASDTAGLAALTSLAAAGSPSTRQTPAPAREAVIDDKAATATAPRAMAAQAGALSTDRPDLSSTQGDEDADAGTAGDEPADLALFAADTTPGAGSSQWLQQPAGAALQATTGVSGPNPSAPVSAATVFLTPEVGSSEWSKAFGQQVVHMGSAGNQVTELQLNPPELGPLKVTLSMIDQQVQAVFVSAHSSVRAAVEAALPQLRTLLAESGISLGNTSVGSESQPQTAFSNGQNGQNSQLSREIYRTAETDASALLSARQVTQPVQRSSSSLRIDTYA